MTQSDPWTAAANARIDWPKVLDDIAYMLGEPLPSNPLLREELSERKLAEALKVARGTLVGWKGGSEPRHCDGEVLVTHWCRLTGKARTFIHVDRFAFSAHKASAPTRGSEKPRAAGMALQAVCMRWAG